MPASLSRPKHRAGTITVSRESDEILAVCLDGEFDLANSRDLHYELDGVLEGGKDLICDLGNATYIDSSVVHALMRAARVARDRKRAMVLQLGTADIVERVVQLLNVEEVIPRARDRHDAVEMIHIHRQAAASEPRTGS